MLALFFIATTSAVPQELGQYSYLSTQFDGTSFESTLDFAQLEPSDSITLPLSSCVQVSTDTDFTFKFWFQATQSDAQLVNFPLSVSCYTTAAPFSVVCMTPKHSYLQAQVADFVEGKWYYFALTVSMSGDASLMIFDNQSLISSDETSHFSFKQTVPTNWTVCLGKCNNQQKLFKNGLQGGIREVVALNTYQGLETIADQKHRIQLYNNKVVGYYRFSNAEPRMFKLEQFREWPANTTAMPMQQQVPITTCPISFNTSNLLQIPLNQSLQQAKVDTKLKQTLYTYTMSITMLVNSDVCITDDLQKAANGCNLLIFDEVFMMYFNQPNAARFHFYAYRNYYEFQSNTFFIPYNEWITVQFMMTQLDGYQVVVMDALSSVITNFGRSQNMQQQAPLGTFQLFKGFSGMVSRFVLSDKAYNLPKPVTDIIDSSTIIDLSFFDVQNQTVSNLSLAQLPTSQIVPYFALEFDQTFTAPIFDGIACQNSLNAMKLTSLQSNFSFNTPQMSDWMSQTSVHFWFKITDWQQVTGPNKTRTQSILSMLGQSDTDQYWLILIRNGQLIVAPFGLATSQQPQLMFQAFNEENQDNTGWWHLSCFYQFYASATCTLNNQAINEVQSQSLMALQQFYFPQYSLEVIVGRNKFFSGVQGLLIKEFSYFNRKIVESEQTLLLHQQLDPNTPGLLNYFRLSTLNPKDEIKQTTQVRSFGLSWQPDYHIELTSTYVEAKLSFVNITATVPLVVCPVGSFFKDNRCLVDPVQAARLLVFPQWNTTSNKLDWLLTVNQSSFTSQVAAKSLKYKWFTDDASLQQVMHNEPRQWVSQSLLKQQQTYQLSASMSTNEHLFEAKPTLSFTPNSCKWFEVYAFDAYTGYRELQQLPGKQDFTFKLILKQNQNMPCSNYPFYDRFDNITFEFFLNDYSDTYILNQPQVSYVLRSAAVQTANPNNSTSLLSLIETANDLNIYVTIPASEQYKLPVWKKFKLLMSISWQSSGFAASPSVFQHAMQSFYFNPQDTYLIVNLTQNYHYVSKYQTLIVSAANTTVSGLQPGSVKHMFSYEWICPIGFEVLCLGQSTEQLFVPWNMLKLVNLTFQTHYTFSCQVTWTHYDGMNETRSNFITVQWYNLQPPKFQIAHSPDPILVTSPYSQAFILNGTTFGPNDDLSIFNITWSFNPTIPQSAITVGNNNVTIAPSTLRQNTYYTVNVTLVYKWESLINGSAQYSFQTTAPPQNGNVYITPTQGYLGDTFNITIRNYTDATSPVYFNVFTTLDQEGLQMGNRVNLKLLASTRTFGYIANTSNPIVVQVINQKGEYTNVVLKPWIVQKPPQVCNTQTICSSNATQNNTGPPPPTNSSGKPDSSSIPTANTALQRLQATTSNATNNDTTVTTIVMDGCSYVTTCVQPQFNFTQPRSNATGERRLEQLSCQDLAISLLKNETTAQQMLSLYEERREMCILDSILQNTSEVNVIAEMLQLLIGAADYRSLNIEIVKIHIDEQPFVLKALDTTFMVEPLSLLAQIQDLNNDLIIQATALKDANLVTSVQYQIIDQQTNKVIFLKDLDGTIKLQFSVSPATYISGQTVCQGQLPSKSWSSDICLTELEIQEKVVTCTCSLTQGVTVLSFNQDYSLPKSVAVVFPQEPQVAVLQGTSLFLVGLVVLIWLFGMIGSVVTIKIDRKKQLIQEWQLETAKNVASQINQNLEVVALRVQDFCNVQSEVLAISNKIHPLVAPFTTSIATQSRLLRFSAYFLQISLFELGLMIYFGPMYRESDSIREKQFIDQIDITSITNTALIGSVLLLPIISVPLCELLSNELVITDSTASLKKRRVHLRTVFLFACQVLSFLPLLGAKEICKQVPTANQYTLSASIIGGLLLATIGSNLLRVLLNTYSSTPYITSVHARQLLKDLSSVKSHKKEECEIPQVSEPIFEVSEELKFNTEQQSRHTSFEIYQEQRHKSVV